MDNAQTITEDILAVMGNNAPNELPVASIRKAVFSADKLMAALSLSSIQIDPATLRYKGLPTPFSLTIKTVCVSFQRTKPGSFDPDRGVALARALAGALCAAGATFYAFRQAKPHGMRLTVKTVEATGKDGDKGWHVRGFEPKEGLQVRTK